MIPEVFFFSKDVNLYVLVFHKYYFSTKQTADEVLIGCVCCPISSTAVICWQQKEHNHFNHLNMIKHCKFQGKPALVFKMLSWT